MPCLIFAVFLAAFMTAPAIAVPAVRSGAAWADVGVVDAIATYHAKANQSMMFFCDAVNAQSMTWMGSDYVTYPMTWKGYENYGEYQDQWLGDGHYTRSTFLGTPKDCYTDCIMQSLLTSSAPAGSPGDVTGVTCVVTDSNGYEYHTDI